MYLSENEKELERLKEYLKNFEGNNSKEIKERLQKILEISNNIDIFNKSLKELEDRKEIVKEKIDELKEEISKKEEEEYKINKNLINLEYNLDIEEIKLGKIIEKIDELEEEIKELEDLSNLKERYVEILNSEIASLKNLIEELKK